MSSSVQGYESPNDASLRSPLLSTTPIQSQERQVQARPAVVRYLTVIVVASVLAFMGIRHLTPFSREENVQPKHEASTSDSVVFAAIGDWGRRGAFHERDVANALAAVLPTEASCIISVGDNFYEDGVTSVHDPSFNQSFEDVFSQPRIARVPWHVALGNHDHFGSVRAQILYSHISPRWNMPARYFSHWLSSRLLAIFLDTTPLSDTRSGEIARKKINEKPTVQLAWLAHTLANAPSKSRFVIIGHHNMYSMSVADHQGVLSVRNVVEPILFPYFKRVVAYIAGHEHAMMHMQPYGSTYPPIANVDHFVSGAGSKLRAVTLPPLTRADYWRKCCGVLAMTGNHTLPGTLWGGAVNGFFVFRLEGDSFHATAFDDSAEVIYQYQKQFPPL